jgi:hypothetical protein
MIAGFIMDGALGSRIEKLILDLGIVLVLSVGFIRKKQSGRWIGRGRNELCNRLQATQAHTGWLFFLEAPP